MNSTSEPLLTSKELASILRHSLRYVYAMKACGFDMPGGTATLSEARQWLRNNPAPRARKPARRAPLAATPRRMATVDA